MLSRGNGVLAVNGFLSFFVIKSFQSICSDDDSIFLTLTLYHYYCLLSFPNPRTFLTILRGLEPNPVFFSRYSFFNFIFYLSLCFSLLEFHAISFLPIFHFVSLPLPILGRRRNLEGQKLGFNALSHSDLQ